MNFTLITGASKGIGKAFAYECAAHQYNLLLVARSASKLAELANDLRRKNITVHTFVADLLAADAHKKVFGWIDENNFKVNMLINNAGMGYLGKFDEKPLEKHLEVMRLNMDAVVRMAYEFLHHDNANEKKYLLNTSSTGAFQPTPYMAVYCASKSFVLSFSEAIRYELRNENVNVTALCPGGTESEFFTPAGMEKVVEKNAQFMMPANEVAKIGLNALLKNKSVAIPGFVNKIGAVAAKLAPRSIVVPAASSFFKV